MAQAGGDLNKPMVVFCVNSEQFAGYNLVLRLAALGYTYVHSTVRGPEEGTWAPGYYSVLFEDPDGIRLEMCFATVPPISLTAAAHRSTSSRERARRQRWCSPTRCCTKRSF
jgi:hypothetical protein